MAVAAAIAYCVEDIHCLSFLDFENWPHTIPQTLNAEDATDAEEIRRKANLVFLCAPPRPVRPLRRQYESGSTRRGYHVTFPTRASLRAAENKGRVSFSFHRARRRSVRAVARSARA